MGFRILSLGSALIVIVLIALPLLAISVQTVFPHIFASPPSLVPSAGALKSLLADPYMLSSGLDSLVLAALTALVGSAIGIAVAYLLCMTDIPARGFLWGLVWLVLISPSFLLAQGWELLLAPGGLTHQVFGGILTHTLLSPVGVMLILSLKLFPFSTLATASALEGLGQDVVHAGRLSGARPSMVWRRILLPLLIPAIVSGGLIIFAEVLSDFGVAATLAQTANFPLATFAIYNALEQFPVNFPEASAASLLLVMAVASAQWFERFVNGRRLYVTRWGGNRTLVRASLGRRRLWAVMGILLFMAVAFGIPAATTILASFMPTNSGGLMVSGSLTLANYADAVHISYGLSSFRTSFWYGVTAATAGLLAGIVVTLAGRGTRGWWASILKGLLTTAIAVPGIVLGAGYIFFWDQPVFKDLGLLLYGTPVVLALAYVAGGLPYAVRVATGGMAQISPSTVYAARMSGARLFSTVRFILIPMLGRTWTRIWLMLFTGVMFELPVSQLLYPPGGPTLAVAVVHQYHDTAFGTGAALTVMSTGAVGLVALVITYLEHYLGRWRRRQSEALVPKVVAKSQKIPWAQGGDA